MAAPVERNIDSRTLKEFTKFCQTKSIIVQYSDMDEEMQNEANEIVQSGIDTNTSEAKIDLEAASKAIKDKMDKRYGAYWHCIIGEGFAFDISTQSKSTLYLFYGGSLAVLIYKC